MTYKTHIAFAIAPVLAIDNMSINLIGIYAITFYIGLIVGALAPDLDEIESKLGKMLPIFPIIYGLLGIKHRGLTHRFIYVVFLVGIYFFFNGFTEMDSYSSLLFIGFIVGYIMHLFGDMLTKGGINEFFYPLSKKQGVLLPRGLRFYTNSREEFLLYSFLVIVIFAELFFFYGIKLL